MTKKILVVLTALFLCVTLSVTVFAEGATLRLMDHANLLSDGQENALIRRLDSVSERYRVDLVIVTIDTTEGYSPATYADRYYDRLKYGYGDDRDGIMLLVSMEDRDWYILTNGLGHKAVTNREVEEIGSAVASSLSRANYVAAFNDFIDEVEEEMEETVYGEPFDFTQNLLICLAIGLVIALIVTGVMRSKLKSVRRQSAATEYVKPGSMQVTMANEFFLYRTINRRKKESSNTSSIGSSRGGGGGKF